MLIGVVFLLLSGTSFSANVHLNMLNRNKVVTLGNMMSKSLMD